MILVGGPSVCLFLSVKHPANVPAGPPSNCTDWNYRSFLSVPSKVYVNTLYAVGTTGPTVGGRSDSFQLNSAWLYKKTKQAVYLLSPFNSIWYIPLTHKLLKN